MVKGVSRQVIVVQSPDPEMFEQAIFILRDSAVKKGVTEDALMKEAKKLVKCGRYESKRQKSVTELCWALGGAVITGSIWLLCTLIY